MKKIIFIILFLFMIQYPINTFASDIDDNIKKQEESLGISAFIKESENYTKNVFENVDLNKTYKDALSGNINTKGLLNGIINIAGGEIQKTIRTLGYILIIVVIHSIIKSISEGVENDEIGQITFYVEYILIVTLIMTNFSDVIILIKETVNNLVGFLNSLTPIMIALMIATGNITTASTVEPILLLLITFIRKYYIIFIYTSYSDTELL